MRNWDDLKYCLALYNHGTMSDAAKVLGSNVATVSRRLHRLSEEIGETLFIKEGNRWAATEAGVEFARIAEQFQNRIGHSGASQRSSDIVLIRLSCAMQIMQCGLVDGIVNFLTEHPSTRLRLETRKRSLALNECDLRMGFEEPNEGRIVRRFMTRMEIVPVCWQGHRDRIEGWIDVAYADDDTSISEALAHHFDAPAKIEIEGLNLTKLILTSNPLVAAVPYVFLERSQGFVEYPMARRVGSLSVWLSYHESRRRDPAVRLAVEFLEQAMNLGSGYAPVAMVR